MSMNAIIDLTGELSENETSPIKVADNALRNFKSRVWPTIGEDPENGPSPRKAAANALQTFRPRKEKEVVVANAGSLDGSNGRLKGLQERGTKTGNDQADERAAPLDHGLAWTQRGIYSAPSAGSEAGLPRQGADATKLPPFETKVTGTHAITRVSDAVQVQKFHDYHAKEAARKKSPRKLPRASPPFGIGANASRPKPLGTSLTPGLPDVTAKPTTRQQPEESQLEPSKSSQAPLMSLQDQQYPTIKESGGAGSTRATRTSWTEPFHGTLRPFKWQKATEPERAPQHISQQRRVAPLLGQQPMQPVENGSSKLDPQVSQGSTKGQQRPVQTNEPTQPRKSRASGNPGQAAANSAHNTPYSPAEDALLKRLREQDKLDWDSILGHFNGRSKGSLQVRYSTKLKAKTISVREVNSKHTPSAPVSQPFLPEVQEERRSASAELSKRQAPHRRQRGVGPSVTTGFVSWKDVRDKKLLDETQAPAKAEPTPDYVQPDLFERQDSAFPNSLGRVLRSRELGVINARATKAASKASSDQLKHHILDTLGPRKYFKGTSGDVNNVAWRPDGRYFAAGSIAITDERSMQYNRPCNLLFGDLDTNTLRELPEHHVPRPEMGLSTGNVNSRSSMRETQDSRLFMTVASVGFSPEGDRLLTAGGDRKVRVYDSRDLESAHCLQAFEHPAPVDLLSVSSDGVLATACHSAAEGGISAYSREAAHGRYNLISQPRPPGASMPIFPSSLKWGHAYQHKSYLLAGFTSDSVDQEMMKAGGTCLWDLRNDIPVDIGAVTRNVFDVAWNNWPSSTSIAFAIASAPGGQKLGRGTRSLIQCFAPGQGRAKRLLGWECPALDINDVLFCPHDANLIAAGATDSKVYIWDQRFSKQSQAPLHILAHGETLSVLDHDRDVEAADTGVRFLAWGATSSRLYSGSSDGVVKVWNPYRSTANAHIKDVATFSSAVMSGSFSYDYQDLLIGEDQGQINLLSVGYEGKSARAAKRFDLASAPSPLKDVETSIQTGKVMLQSKEIQFRPMGDLPVRQAVQGPAYEGPYLRPSELEIVGAERVYKESIEAQNEAHSRAAMTASQGSLIGAELRDVDNRVRDAQVTIERLESRQRDADSLEPAAYALQRRLRKKTKDRMKLEAIMREPVAPCRLECNYLPVDTDGEVPDTGRSKSRIPDMLRRVRPEFLDPSALSAAELLEHGLTARCTSCFGPACKAPNGKPNMCESCALKRSGLTFKCTRCSAPVRAKQELCERCDFACFRCCRPARISPAGSLVTCTSCALVWEADVLGYTLVHTSEQVLEEMEQRTSTKATIGIQEEVGDGHIAYLAAKWQDKSHALWDESLRQLYKSH